MSGIHDQERLETLRKRLYKRGKKTKQRTPYTIPENKPKTSAPRSWPSPPSAKPARAAGTTKNTPAARSAPASTQNKNTPPLTADTPIETPVLETESSGIVEKLMGSRKKGWRWRLKIIVAAVGFFVLAMLVSSFLLLSGGNTISGENITLSVTGPFTVGGGETLPLQVGITNDNSVAMQSAMLIVEYPTGSRSPDDDGEALTVERVPLETIDSGETLNIPLRVVVFGEENSEKMVAVSIEYRVAGSNATFFKEAEPLRFKIGSSPIVLQIDSDTKISSGQQTEITLNITSNAPSTISDVLVTAEYPTGFDIVGSTPEPVSGNNTWSIDTLEPQETVSITVDAIITGTEADERVAHFSVGVPQEQDPFTLASVFSSDSATYEIEQPFIDINFEVGDSADGTEVVTAGQPVGMSIEFSNTLNDTLYDAVITAELTGNALDASDVDSQNGFYDSTRNIITWDASTISGLETILPGDEERLSFTLTPDENVARTPQIDMKISVRARRVSETRVPEQLIGTAEGTIRVATALTLLSESRYTVGAFEGSGPVPPEAEEITIYTLSMLVDNGANRLSDVEVTTTLPNYVNWLNESGGDGSVRFNDTSRELTWEVDEVADDDTAMTSFQVSFQPSRSQVGTTPVLMGEQRLRANDQFTGSAVRVTREAVTTELSTEAGYQSGNGRVQG